MIKETTCPHCGQVINGHASIEAGALPSVNDLSICAKCAKWNKFDDNLNLIKFTEEDEKNADPALISQLKLISSELLKSKN